jgi:broad specificity phosphatase PhoE
MNRLYWVRHGESEVNLTKEFSCRLVDPPLTPKGVLQAQQTAAYLAGIEIAVIYCSPLKRTVETARMIGDRVGLPVTPLEFFREIDCGDLEQRPPTPENWAIFLGIVDAWKHGNHHMAFPGGEDYITMLGRMKAGFKYLIENHPDQPVLVVGHGGSFSATIPSWCADAAKADGKQVDNCSITEIEMEKAGDEVRGKLVQWASITHLQGQAAQVVSGLPDEFVKGILGS